MKIVVNEQDVVLEAAYPDWETLYAAFARARVTAGRDVPSFDAVSIGISLGLFLLNQALTEWRARRSRAASAEQERKLDALLAELRSGTAGLVEMRKTMLELDLRIRVAPEYQVDRDILSALLEIDGGNGVISVGAESER